MRTKIRRLSTFISLFLLCMVFLSCMSGCNREGGESRYQETEYFKYYVYKMDGEERAVIQGMTEKGKQQKNIVIPEEIDGKRVVIYDGHDTAPNVRKIIISYNVRTINSTGFTYGNSFVNGYKGGLKILYVNCKHKESANFGKGGYIATNAREEYSKFLGAYHFANMQYLYNYPDSPNKDVFFIDDLEVNEELEIIPEIPKREGYTFTGWYAEPECTNKIELNSYVKTDEEIVYLYAGWEENK